MANATQRPAPPAAAEPISAMALAAAAEPPPPAPIPSIPQLLLERARPLAAHGFLFLMGLTGGLAVATAGSLTLHYLNDGGGSQIAAARISVQPQPVEPLAVQIQKAKAELDAALNNGS